MKKIKWKKRHKDLYAQMGNVYLDCCRYQVSSGIFIWQATVSIRCLSNHWREGPERRSLSEAKIDAARLVEELLLDCHTSLDREMKCCGVEV